MEPCFAKKQVAYPEALSYNHITDRYLPCHIPQEETYGKEEI